MKWQEIEISLSHPAAEALAVYLDDTEQMGVSMDDPAAVARLRQRGGWEAEDLAEADDPTGEVRVRFYAAQEKSLEAILGGVARQMDLLRQSGLETGSGRIRTRTVDEEDWAHAWKAYFKPTPVGDRLWIQPVWEQADPPADRFCLWIDPGMAFGTGTHPTTRLCLEILDQIIRGGETVLDIGTGSGILAIAAVLLGAAQVRGVDIDSHAVRVAQDNSRLNRVQDRTSFETGTCDHLEGPAQVIVANIVADIIMDILPCVQTRLSAGGLFNDRNRSKPVRHFVL